MDNNKLYLWGAALLCASSAAMANPIDLNKARQTAEPFVAEGTTPVLVAQATRREAKARLLDEQTRTTAPYYVFSRGPQCGYVIVSGDDCLPEILGYTESGDFDEENMPPQLRAWLDHYAEVIEEAQSQGANQSRSRRTVGDDAEAHARATESRVSIEPLMTTHWHQEWPYNSHCPFMKGTKDRAMTGCVATAAAQVVYYYRKDNPSELQSTTPTYGYGEAPVTESYKKGMPLKWDLMLNSYNGSRPAEYDDAVGTFMAALGAATWLTYGQKPGDRSTAGQISALVNTFNSCFNMTGTCKYKSEGYTQTSWERQLYGELSAGRPVVYAGYNPESGGHAVVVDGYRSAGNLFHFNFGWGGQGDGYYTVDNETGMNGFSAEQGMVFGIAPKKQNLEAELAASSTANLSRTNTVRVTVRNNGTLPYSGIYLFANSTGKKPTAVSQARSKDTETVVPATGEEVTLEMTYKPTTNKNWHLFVTDKNCNVLAQAEVEMQVPESDITLNSIAIDGSSETEEHEGEKYTVVYNNRAACVATLTNNSAIDYEATPDLRIYASEDGGKTFAQLGDKSTTAKVGSGKTETVSFNIINSGSLPIEEGKLYMAHLVNPVKESFTTDTIKYATTDTIVRFTLKGSTLSADKFEDGCLYFSGDWDATTFSSVVNRPTYKAVTTIDLTGVKGVAKVPEVEANPNALIYVSDESAAIGKNVVKQTAATCDELQLTAGYDFCPRSPFSASKAVVNINQTPHGWYLLTTPCAVAVPDGIIARSIDTHNSIGISNHTTNVAKLEAGKTYLVMTSHAGNQSLTGENVEVAASPVANADEAVKGTFTATAAPEQSLVASPETNYFELLEGDAMAEALRGYFHADNLTRRFRAYSSVTIDPQYLLLSECIDKCREILEDYKPVVTSDAYEAFADSIALAENVFSEQSLTSSLLIKKYVTRMTDNSEWYKKQLPEGVAGVRIDYTELIANPSFESKTTKGWTVEAATAKSVNVSTNLNLKGVGADGDYLLYSFASDSTGVGISQIVTGLRPGTYELTAMIGTDHDNTVTMFAGQRKTTVAAHPFGRFYLTEAKIEDIEVGEEGTLEIGVEAGRWYKADDFKLFCTSTAAADPNSIEQLDADTNSNASLAVKAIAGGVSITTVKPVSVSVFSLSGAKLLEKKISGTENIMLRRGIYIICGKKVAVM